MAFKRENFTNLFLNSSEVPSEYSYKTTDAINTVLADGYFNDLYDILKVGDILKIFASNAVTFVQVSENTAGVVKTTDGTDIV